MEYRDYYKILGVDKKANDDDIKQAYRRLARKYHPDVSKEANAEEKFKDIKEAYEVLKDKEKRAAYDELGSNWRAGQEFKPPPGWEGFKRRQYTTQDFGDFDTGDMGGFSDFFSNLFGGGGRHKRDTYDGFQQGFQSRGNDQHAKISISLEDAFHGATKTLHLQMSDVDANGMLYPKTRTLKVNIPAGSLEGQQLRLAGQGEAGVGGGVSGDLYFEIHIESHPYFSLEKKDIYLTLPISPWEAALGAEIKVPTLAGPVGLKLKPGIQSGQKMRLKGRGMPGKPNPGDQYAIVQIHTPKAETEADKQLYEKMAQIMPFNPRKDWAV